MDNLQAEKENLEKEKEEWEATKVKEREEIMKEVNEEKKKWEDEKAQVMQINSIQNDIVDLNVSGITKGFTVTKSLMRSYPGSKLDTMFSGNYALQYKDDRIFVNRDPQIF